MRGGPTVDADGRVVGVNSVDPDRASQESDLITPASEVGQLLRDEGVRNEVGITIGPFAIDVHIVESLEADPRATVVAD
jgi:hypothetical protein